MKSYILIAVCFLLAIACKKNEEPQPEGYLSSIRFTNGSSFDLTYKLFYDNNKKLERISFKGTSGSTPFNKHYFLKYDTGSKLDSVILFDSISNTRLGAVGADWTGNNMTFSGPAPTHTMAKTGLPISVLPQVIHSELYFCQILL